MCLLSAQTSPTLFPIHTGSSGHVHASIRWYRRKPGCSMLREKHPANVRLEGYALAAVHRAYSAAFLLQPRFVSPLCGSSLHTFITTLRPGTVGHFRDNDIHCHVLALGWHRLDANTVALDFHHTLLSVQRLMPRLRHRLAAIRRDDGARRP